MPNSTDPQQRGVVANRCLSDVRDIGHPQVVGYGGGRNPTRESCRCRSSKLLEFFGEAFRTLLLIFAQVLFAGHTTPR